MAAPRTKPKFRSPLWRGGNAVVGLFARLGVGPIQLLTTRGRRTRRPETVPVVPVVGQQRRWLVAPYGAVDWVRNTRASGRVSMRYGRSTHEYLTRELSAMEAAPVLKEYVVIAPRAASQFEATPDDPEEAFAADAHTHPVFELVEVR